MTNSELKEFMAKHGLGCAEMADLLGVTFMAVDHWLTGRRSISLSMGRLIRLFDKRPELMREYGK